MNLLIAGCGDLGTELGLRAAAAGHRVHGVRRRPEHLPEPIVGLRGDLTQPLAGLPSDTDLLVYAAAPGERTPAGYRDTYVDGPGRVLSALDEVGAEVERVLFVASTAVYGVEDGSWVDETTPTEPTSTTGPLLVEAERRLWERRPDAISLRLAGVYGPGRTRLIDQVREGRAVIPEPPVHTNRMHRDDAARAILHLLTSVGDPATCYLGVDDDPADRGEVLRFLADELGMPHPPTGPDQRSRGGDKRCRNDRLRGTGFTLEYPTYREGYRAILAGRGVRHP